MNASSRAVKTSTGVVAVPALIHGPGLPADRLVLPAGDNDAVECLPTVRGVRHAPASDLAAGHAPSRVLRSV